MSENLPDQKKTDPQKIEGLLLLLGILLILQGLRYLANTEDALKPIIDATAWNSLTTPGALDYHPLWRVLLIYQLSLQILLGLASAGLGIMLFARYRLFPKLFLIFLGLQVVVALSLVIFAHILTPQTTDDSTRQFVQSVCVCALGTVYILRSDRVRLTFRAQKSDEELKGITVY